MKYKVAAAFLLMLALAILVPGSPPAATLSEGWGGSYYDSDDYELRVSESSNRFGSKSLEGRTVSDDIFVFLFPGSNVDRVEFYLNDPDTGGSPYRIENSRPFDLEGTYSNGRAAPFDTTDLADGSNTITTIVKLYNNEEVVFDTTFMVDNTSSPAPDFKLKVSESSSRWNSESLEGKTVSDNIYVFLSPDDDVDRVDFYIDDTDMSGSPHRTELAKPYDLSGTNSDGKAAPFNTNTLSDGPHTITTAVTRNNGSEVVFDTTFEVSNGGGSPAPDFELRVSESSHRWNSKSLEGETTSGKIYVFLSPDNFVDRVDFYMDDTDMSGSPLRTETSRPYDLQGTYTNGDAAPFDTKDLANGTHIITTKIKLDNNQIVVFDTSFEVDNGSSGFSLRVSESSNRSNSESLGGETVSGDVYVFLSPDYFVDKVKFYINDTDMSESPYRTESSKPFDLEGTFSNGNAAPFDTTELSDGPNTITTSVKLYTWHTIVFHTTFNVNNGGSTNNAPVVDAIADQTMDEGASLVVNISASDIDGDIVDFDDSLLPSFATLTDNGNNTGSITFEPALGDADEYTVTVIATDPGGLSDSTDFTLTVDELMAGGAELPTEGLIGYWPFDEGSGATAQDSTSNNNDGLLVGGPTWTSSGLEGGAISFDGVDDYVTMGDQALFELPEYTWSIWVNSATTPALGPTTQPLSNADHQFSFSWNHDKVRFVGSAAHATGEETFVGAQIFSPIPADNWHNIVGTYDGTLLRIYLDGALHEVAGGTAPVTAEGELRVAAGVAADLTPINFFAGSVDELRIYDRALSHVEVDVLSRQGSSENVNLNSALTAHWAFDEGTGQTADDSGANDLDGTLGADTNVGTDDPTWVSGAVGSGALSFDGVNDYVTAGDQPEFELLDEYSWSLWVNASAPPGTTQTTQPLSNADQQFVMSWDHANSAFVASAAHGTGGGDFISAQIGSELLADTWYHVTATFDGENLRIYLDGVLEAALFVGGGPVQADGPLHIGAGVNTAGNPTVFFSGSIDDVRVYSRVLNGLEVEALAAQ